MVTGFNWYYCCEFLHLTVLLSRKKWHFALFLMMLFCFVYKWCFMHVVNAVVCTVVVYNSSFLLWMVAFGALTLWDWAVWRTFSLYKNSADMCAGGSVVIRALHALQLQNFDSITSSIISCCIKLQNDLTFYNQLTKVILECWQLNECYFC